MNNKKAFTPIELVIALLLISVFIYVIYARYKSLEIKSKLLLTKIDIRNLNLAVKIFKLKYSRNPKDLYELKEKKCLNIKGSTIISKKSFFKGKVLLDPFGNPYQYDNIYGHVSLSKKTLKLFEKNF